MRCSLFAISATGALVAGLSASWAAPLPVTNDPRIDGWISRLNDDLTQYQSAPEKAFALPSASVDTPCAQSPDALKAALHIAVPGAPLNADEIETKKAQARALRDKGIPPRDMVISDVVPYFVTATCSPAGLEGPFDAYATYVSGVAGDPKPNRFVEHIQGTMRAGHFVGEVKVAQRMTSAFFPEPFVTFSYADSVPASRDLPNAMLTYSNVAGAPSIMVSFSKSVGGDRWFAETYQNGQLFSHIDMKGPYYHGRKVVKTQVECFDTGEKIMDPECAVK